MAKVKSNYQYTSINNLATRIYDLQKERRAASMGKPVNVRDLMSEIAAYCSLSRQTVDKVRGNENQPSAATMLKLAEYFNKPVEQIFMLIPTACPECNTPWDVKGKKLPLKMVCENCGHEYEADLAVED